MIQDARYLELVGRLGPDKEGRRYGWFGPAAFWSKRGRLIVIIGEKEVKEVKED